MTVGIRTKILASFMAMVGLLIALAVFALVSVQIMAEGNRRLIRVQEKVGLVSDLQVTIDRAVNALGEYLVSGDKARRVTAVQLILFSRERAAALSAALGPSGTGRREERLEMEKAAALAAEIAKIEADTGEALALADTIEKEGGRKVIREAVPSVKGILSQDRPRLPPPASHLANDDLRTLEGLLGVSTRDVGERLRELEALGKTISRSESKLRGLSLSLIQSKDRALETIGELREIAEREGMRAVASAGLAGRRARKYTLVGGVTVLACGLVLALYLSRSFSRPIMELDRGAKLLGEGHFDHRMSLDTGDELEGLAHRFNSMAARLQAYYRDLEARVRERTRELEGSNLQLRRLFDGISDGISVIDREYGIVNANRGIAAMAGADEGELVGSRCHRAYNGSDAPCPGCPAAETFRTGSAASGELRWASPGGKCRDMQINIFPLLEEEGRVVQVIEYAKDVSEKIALERKLFQSAKLAGIGTLAAGVAHEIRNPLGIMKTSADMIRRATREGEQNRELAEFLIEEVDRLNRVVTRLLDFARPSVPQMEPCDIGEILERALALVGPQHRLKDLEVVSAFAEGLPPILGDRGQLCQVFLNLIINAVQAMPDGGRLTLATGLGEGGAVFASLGDTGAGIDEGILNHIFDPFFSTKDDGSGLGLSIVHRIVEAHGGRIDVRSAPGEGTVFTVALPAA